MTTKPRGSLRPTGPSDSNEPPAHTPSPSDPTPTPREWRPGEIIGSGTVRTDVAGVAAEKPAS